MATVEDVRELKPRAANLGENDEGGKDIRDGDGDDDRVRGDDG